MSGELITYSDIHFAIMWMQPIFWMLFFHYKTEKLDKFITLLVVSLVGITVSVEFIPSLNTLVYGSYPTAKLLFLYGTLGCMFGWYLVRVKEWHLPQALSISALAVFIGSYYWEAPYIIRNAILVGFEWDWFLHAMVIFLVWYVRDSVGWCPDKRRLIYLVSIGLIVSMIVMIIDPIPPRAGIATKWNAPHYLLNRVVCSTIIFMLVDKDIETNGEEEDDSLRRD